MQLKRTEDINLPRTVYVWERWHGVWVAFHPKLAKYPCDTLVPRLWNVWHGSVQPETEFERIIAFAGMLSVQLYYAPMVALPPHWDDNRWRRTDLDGLRNLIFVRGFLGEGEEQPMKEDID